MRNVVSVRNMRESDRRTIEEGTPGLTLMERAGRAIFEAGEWKEPVAVVCGKGNNAGDGFVLAAALHENGIRCRILLRERTFTADGAVCFARCEALGIPVSLWSEIQDLKEYGSIADCMLGTGFRGTPDGETSRIIDLINRSGAYTVSADINSGLNGDNGLAERAVRSDLTVAVGYLKTGHLLNMAGDLIGSLSCADIGIRVVGRTYGLFGEEDARAVFAPRPRFCNKGTWGTAVLIGGSVRYSGAVKLANMSAGAARCGCGVVRIGAPDCIAEAIMPRILESTLFPLSSADGGIRFREEEFRELTRGAGSVAFGMGVGLTEETRKAVAWLVNNTRCALVIDADGLNALADMRPDILKQREAPVILTPHPGEFSRMTGKTVREILEDPIGSAEAYAREHRVILLLKGTTTVVTDGTRTILTDRGCAGMATAGSGDVLSGIIAACCAWNDDPLTATAAAAWLNGLAGEIAGTRFGDIAMTAGDTSACIREALADISAPGCEGDTDA